jgi:hypothetical protein
MTDSSVRKTIITDSPWYWVYVFSAAGLIALAIMGPKFESRQMQIERKSQARQRAAQQVAGEVPRTPLSTGETLVIRLWPLYSVLGLLLVFAVWNLWRARMRPQATPLVPAQRGAASGEGTQ